jgi:hypothetical protein
MELDKRVTQTAAQCRSKRAAPNWNGGIME